METDGVHENMMSSELRYVLLQTFTAIDDLIHRAEGQEPEEADNIINFFSRDSVAHFKPDGPGECFD